MIRTPTGENSPPVLRGECNRCGLCCCDPGGARCQNLVLDLAPGLPWAGWCRVYDTRTDAMAITMIRRDGTSYPSKCYKDSPMEDLAIVLKGIGQGCSLEVVK